MWTRRPEVAAEFAERFATSAYADFDALLDAVDAVAFAVPPQVQAELAVRAAAAGKHLICEKPLAGTVEDARAVAGAVERAGVLTTVVLTMRHDPAVCDWLGTLPEEPADGNTVATARWLSGALLGGPYAVSPWRSTGGSWTSAPT